LKQHHRAVSERNFRNFKQLPEDEDDTSAFRSTPTVARITLVDRIQQTRWVFDGMGFKPRTLLFRSRDLITGNIYQERCSMNVW
ncbi:hypothetical protein AVEN_274674-1, partial [Araneus ventricosus]